MSVSRAIATRLRNERLVGSPLRCGEDVVAWMGAVQAQDYAGARWAIGQRMRGAVDTDVQRAFDEGRFLRTHILRPTWHFVHPGDIRWMLALSGPRVHVVNGFSYRTNGLDAATRVRGAEVICRALEGHRRLTRTELASALEAAKLPHAGQALAYMVMYAELEGLVCSGPRRGKQFTYALIDERVAPAARRLDPEEALAELVVRYFASHGPATIRDLVWWSGLTTTQAKRGIAAAGSSLEATVIDERTCWWAADARPGRAGARPGRTPAHGAYLLPNYDEFLVAFRDRQWCTPYGGRPPRFGPMVDFPHQLVMAGRVEGSWRQERTRSGMSIEVRPFRRFSAAARLALDEAAVRYASFLEIPVCCTVLSPVGR